MAREALEQVDDTVLYVALEYIDVMMERSPPPSAGIRFALLGVMIAHSLQGFRTAMEMERLAD
jgi:hypothetical protein